MVRDLLLTAGRMHGARIAALVVAAALIASCGGSALVDTGPGTSPSPSPPPRTGAFVPAGAVLYGSIAQNTGRPGNCYPVEEAARFALLDLSMHLARRTSRWCGSPDRPLQAIRALNPDSWVLLYRMAPAELNWVGSARFPVSGGPYYQELRQSHGIGSQDPWFAPGERTGDYLVSRWYPQYMAMDLGNPSWRRYWTEQGWQDMWGPNPVVDARGASGIFVDGAVIGPPYSGAPYCPLSSWDTQNFRCLDSTPDYPATYRAGGTWNTQLWRQHMLDFVREAVAWHAARGLKMMFNVWKLSPDYATFMNQVGGHVMEEAGFVDFGRFPPTTSYWLSRLNNLRSATGFSILSTNNLSGSGDPHPACRDHGTECMDTIIWNGMRAWDVLWFAMTSFLLGYDPQRQNGFFHFTMWGYRDTYWLDEYDPRYLHLGRPLGEAQQLSGGAWIREFEDGWVATNPTGSPVEVTVPRGQARVLGHDNFKNPASAPAVDRFTLQPYRGVVLLRAGASGNRRR
jgi:hypothetical protein